MNIQIAFIATTGRHSGFRVGRRLEVHFEFDSVMLNGAYLQKNPRESEKERKEEKTFFFTSTSVEVYNRFHYTLKNAVLYLHILVKKDL